MYHTCPRAPFFPEKALLFSLFRGTMRPIIIIKCVSVNKESQAEFGKRVCRSASPPACQFAGSPVRRLAREMGEFEAESG